MKAIVCVDKCWGIGKNNELLFSLPEDMKRFKKETLGKVVIMGLNTFRSLPKGPLEDRVNVVLNPSGTPIKGVTVVTSIFKLSQEASKYPQEDLFLIGGAAVYQQLVPFCSEVLVTKVDADGQADKFFPNLDENPQWTLASEGDWLVSKTGLRYQFCTYRQEERYNG